MGQAEDFITALQVSTAANTAEFSEDCALRFDHILIVSCVVRNPRGGDETMTKLPKNS